MERQSIPVACRKIGTSSEFKEEVLQFVVYYLEQDYLNFFSWIGKQQNFLCTTYDDLIMQDAILDP